MNLEQIKRRFSLDDHLTFKEAAGGLIVAEIASRSARASICLQGAQVMTWRPASQAVPVVWLSQQAKLAPGKSIRGGVPVCWPWFGPHAGDASLPAHGFARTRPWAVTGARLCADDAVELTFTLDEDEQTRRQWPHRTPVSLLITVGATLKLALATTNADASAVTVGEALHTYFHIGDIAEISVLGLDGCAYIDKAGGGAHRRQSGPVTFAGETDRIYVDTDAECVIEDRRLRRRIRIAKSGSRSTVVWNPWHEKADKMGDLGPEGWRGMACVESANAADNQVAIAPGATHTLAVEYRVEGLRPV